MATCARSQLYDMIPTLKSLIKASVSEGTQCAAVTTWYAETKVPPQSWDLHVLHMIATCQGHAPGVEIFPPMIWPILNSETERLVSFTPQDTGGGEVVVGGSVGTFLSRAVRRNIREDLRIKRLQMFLVGMDLSSWCNGQMTIVGLKSNYLANKANTNRNSKLKHAINTKRGKKQIKRNKNWRSVCFYF